MLQRILGVTVGAIVTFLLLLLFAGGTRIILGENAAYVVACVIGAITSFFWPVVVGFWLTRRMRSRRESEIQAEVTRQVNEKTRDSGR